MLAPPDIGNPAFKGFPGFVTDTWLMDMDLAFRFQRLTLPEHLQILKVGTSLPETSENSCPISWVAHGCDSWYILLYKTFAEGRCPVRCGYRGKHELQSPKQGYCAKGHFSPKEGAHFQECCGVACTFPGNKASNMAHLSRQQQPSSWHLDLPLLDFHRLSKGSPSPSYRKHSAATISVSDALES